MVAMLAVSLAASRAVPLGSRGCRWAGLSVALWAVMRVVAKAVSSVDQLAVSRAAMLVAEKAVLSVAQLAVSRAA